MTRPIPDADLIAWVSENPQLAAAELMRLRNLCNLLTREIDLVAVLDETKLE